MNTVYNPLKYKEYQSKYNINVAGLSSLAFSLSLVFLFAALIYLMLSLFNFNDPKFINNVGMFLIILTTSYLLNVFAKKHLLKRISEEQLEFIIKHQHTLGIENIEDIFCKKDLIPFLDKAYEIDQKLYQSGERRKEKFILSHSVASL